MKIFRVREEVRVCYGVARHQYVSRVRVDVAGNQNRDTDDTSVWSEATRQIVMDIDIFLNMSGGPGAGTRCDISQSS